MEVEIPSDCAERSNHLDCNEQQEGQSLILPEFMLPIKNKKPIAFGKTIGFELNKIFLI